MTEQLDSSPPGTLLRKLERLGTAALLGYVAGIGGLAILGWGVHELMQTGYAFRVGAVYGSLAVPFAYVLLSRYSHRTQVLLLLVSLLGVGGSFFTRNYATALAQWSIVVAFVTTWSALAWQLPIRRRPR